MNAHETRLRALVSSEDEATVDSALAAAEARGFARAMALAECACTNVAETYADCISPEQVAVRETARALRERIRAMQDDGGGADSRICGCGHPMGGHDGRGCFAYHWVALNEWARCECKVSNPANGMRGAP